ncbi:MAG TPA: hypothetical protein VIY73_17715 [Polyangiaceae bacterium]
MGTSKRTQGKSTDAALAEQLIAGTKKHFTTASPLAFASASFTPAQIETSLQTLATLRNDVDDARTALEAKLAAEKDQAAALVAFMRAFVQFVQATFAKSPDILADFGLKPRKARAPLTVEQQAAAAAKRKATRAARGTKGAKQKAGITGAVTGVTITPVTAAQPAAAVETSGTSAPAITAGATTATPPRS